VANASNAAVSVANVATSDVANASVQMRSDRHRKTPERAKYMRELMRVVRAIKSGRACSWPPGSVSA